MSKPIDLNKAIEILLSPYSRPGTSILGLIDTSFKQYILNTPIDATELSKAFAYDLWRNKLPDLVRAGQPEISASDAQAKVLAALTQLEKSVMKPQKAIPGIAAVHPAAPEKSGPQPRALADILGTFMRPATLQEQSASATSPVEAWDEKPEEHSPPAGISENASSILDKLRQRRAALARVLEKSTSEEEEAASLQIQPSIQSPSKPISIPEAKFSSDLEWYAAKQRRSYIFTKFEFRLTPEEKKFREYIIGSGEFAPKRFILLTAVMELRVRLLKDEASAIAIFWDWFKRGIIEEDTRIEEAEA